MSTTFLKLSTAVICVLLAAPVGCGAPRAVGGELDLTEWNFRRDGIITLDGEWDFYGNTLIPADSFHVPGVSPQPEQILVPGPWNAYLDQTGTPMGPEGFATYRLRIVLPRSDDAPASLPQDELGLFIPYVHTSYQLWIDGQLRAANGVIGRDSSEGRPQFRPEIVRFHPTDDDVDVVLHVSNFHFREGGIPRRLELGTADQIALRHRQREILGGALFGAKIIMAAFFAGVYVLRKEKIADLYFSLFLLSLAVRMLFTGDLLLARLATDIPWELGLKIEYLMDFAAPVLFLHYLRVLFPQDVSGLVVRLWTAVAIVGAAAIVVLSVRVSSQVVPPYLLLVAALLLYSVYVGILATIRKRPHSLFYLTGIVAAIGASLLTMLRYAGVAAIGELIPAGTTVLLLSQSLVLAMRSARTYRKALMLAAENASMLAATQWQLKKLKEYRRLTTLREENLRRGIAEMLHGRTQGRLFNVLRRIDQAERTLETDADAARSLLAEAKSLLDQVREEDIRKTSRKLHPSAVGAGIIAAIESLLDTFDDSYDVHFDVDPKVEQLEEAADGRLRYELRLGVYRIIEEGLNNIARHAQAKTIRLSMTLEQQEGNDVLAFSLTDDGVGFDPASPSAGLGLQTIDARVGDLGGDWQLTGAPGEGTTLRVSIPLPPVPSR